MGVGGQDRLVPIELGPVDVALVMIVDHHVPGLGGLVVPVGLPCPPLFDHDALLAFAVDVGARIEGVLQQPDHVAVADRRPVEGDGAPAVGGPREDHVLGGKRPMYLPRAAQLAEAYEDQTDHLLQAKIGIEVDPGLAMPDVAHGYADTQLAPARLGAGGVKHARPDHAQLELADRALHAEEQPIVRQARIINAVEVDDTCLDEAAELQQVVPVPPVARQSGRVEAEHCADLASAERRHQPLEARPRDHAAGREAQVIVDHLDGSKAAVPGQLHQLVLAAPAFRVGLDLRLGRLTDVDDRLAVRHGGRQRIRDGHRPAPPRSRCLRSPRAAGPPSGSRPAPAPSGSCRAAAASRAA